MLYACELRFSHSTKYITNKKWKKGNHCVSKTFVLPSLLALLLTLIATQSAAMAATSSSKPVDLSVMQKTCAVLLVRLNGPNHTISCLHKTFSRRTPDINRDYNCDSSTDTVDIANYNYTKTVCFQGNGYIGVQIYQVNEVDNLQDFVIEFLWYQPKTCSKIGNYGAHYFGGGTTNKEVTQIDTYSHIC